VAPLRLGYVGCGFMAQRVHLPNFSTLPDCKIVALAELRPELGLRVQQRYGIPRLFRSHQELIADPEVDAVAVSAAFSAQGDIAVDALMAGKCVFMDKPMAVSLDQAQRLLDAEQHGGGRLMVGYMKRYDAGNELVKDHVRQFRETGELGRLQYVRNHGFVGDWVAGLDTPIEQTSDVILAYTLLCRCRRTRAQIRALNGRIVQQIASRPAEDGPSALDDEGRIRDREGLTGILFYQEHGDTLPLEVGYDGEHLANQERCEPERRLVQEEQPRSRHEPPCNGQHLLFSSRKGPGPQETPLRKDREAVVLSVKISGNGRGIGTTVGAE